VGLAAAIFYVAHHITIQTSLFLVTGLIERRGGSSSVDRLGGLAKISPLLALLFFIPGMNLAGIPPFSGFLGKVGLLQAGVELGTPLAYALVIGGVVTSLLTLLAVARVWNRAFWRRPTDAEHPDPVLLAAPGQPVEEDVVDDEPVADGAGRSGLAVPVLSRAGSGGSSTLVRSTLMPRTMVGPTAGLVVLGMALTVFAGPLFGLSDRAAAEMLDRGPYIHAVLGEDVTVPAVGAPAGGGK
jgi:multicomponent Na+:H+ antiporter subunit D